MRISSMLSWRGERRCQELADAPQRQPQRAQRADLPQPREVRRRVNAIARGRAARPQQAHTVVVVQRLDGDASERGEFVNGVHGCGHTCGNGAL